MSVRRGLGLLRLQTVCSRGGVVGLAVNEWPCSSGARASVVMAAAVLSASVCPRFGTFSGVAVVGCRVDAVQDPGGG